jgi:protein SCO1/2
MKPQASLLFAACAALGAALLLLGRAQPLPGLAQAAPVAARGHAAGPRAASLYRLPSVFQSDDGRELKLAELSGKFQIVALMFTRCPSVCPTLVRELQKLEQAMPERVAAATGIALISIDPENDTVAALRAYRAQLGLGARWTLLRSEPESVRELAAVLGFSFSGDGSSPAVHSRLVTLLGPQGQVLHQQAGVADDPARIIQLVAGAL